MAHGNRQQFRLRWPGLCLTGLLAAALMLSGCSSSLQPMGPALAVPELAGDALIAADGYRLPLRVWLPPAGVPVRAAMVALHGFNDYSNAFDLPGQGFAASGIAVYAYDQRGFGASSNRGIWPGTATLTADLRSAVARVADRHAGLPLYVLGESMGAAVVMAALGSDDSLPGVSGAVLVAPAVWGRQVMGFFPRNMLWISNGLVPGFVVHPPDGLNIKASDNIEMLRALGRDPLVIKGARVDALDGLTSLMGTALDAAARLPVPTLALYGEHEQVLPEGPVGRAISALRRGSKTVVALYPEGWHMLLRDLNGAVVVNDVIAWTKNQDHPLVSGADRTREDLAARDP